MNKYLLMSAAAVLSTTATSYAAPKAPVLSGSGHTSFYSTDGTGFAYCNEWSVYWSGVVYGNQDNLSEYCGYAGWVSNGVALKGKVKGYGKVVQLPASIATIEGYPSFGSNFVVSGGIASGHSYVGWGTFEAYSNYEFSAGVIYLGQAAKAKVPMLRSNGHPTPVQNAMFKYAKDHGLPMKNK